MAYFVFGFTGALVLLLVIDSKQSVDSRQFVRVLV